MKTLINTGKSNDDIAKKHFDSEEKERRKQRRISSVPKESLSGLVCAANTTIMLYVCKDKRAWWQVIAATEDDAINTLCYHKGKLYHTGPNGNIYDSISCEKVAERKNPIFALCSHEDVLYDAGEDGIIRETFANQPHGRKVYNAIQYSFDQKLLDLCSHDRDLYVAQESVAIKILLDGNAEYDARNIRDNPIQALVSHNELLYDAGEYGVFETEKKIKLKTGKVKALCSHNDVLYYAGQYGIYSTLADKRIVKVSTDVTALCSTPKEFVDRIMKMEGLPRSIK